MVLFINGFSMGQIYNRQINSWECDLTTWPVCFIKAAGKAMWGWEARHGYLSCAKRPLKFQGSNGVHLPQISPIPKSIALVTGSELIFRWCYSGFSPTPIFMILLRAISSETSAAEWTICSSSQVQVRLTLLSPSERVRDLSETECSHRKKRGWDLVWVWEKQARWL